MMLLSINKLAPDFPRLNSVGRIAIRHLWDNGPDMLEHPKKRGHIFIHNPTKVINLIK